MPVNALFFIAYSSACLTAVWLFDIAVPALAFKGVFYVLGFMSTVSIFLNSTVTTTFETFMEFTTKLDEEEY